MIGMGVDSGGHGRDARLVSALCTLYEGSAAQIVFGGALTSAVFCIAHGIDFRVSMTPGGCISGCCLRLFHAKVVVHCSEDRAASRPTTSLVPCAS